ncbi:hypothetical protein RQP46_001566 [Phenoliferia psychrophenolica]
MSDLPFTAPTKTSGRVILVATIKAKAGKGDEVLPYLAAIRKLAESDQEKGTHTFDLPTLVSLDEELDGDSDVFVVFEEYSLPNGIKDHVFAAPFQALGGSGLIADLDIKYYSEFDGDAKTLHA